MTHTIAGHLCDAKFCQVGSFVVGNRLLEAEQRSALSGESELETAMAVADGARATVGETGEEQ